MKISTQKSAQKGSDLGSIPKIGIFAASLLTAASAIYIYSPVNGTNAASTTKNTIEGAISPVASVTLSANDLNIPITPTEAGAFDSKSITATVRTNSIKGYDLYFSAVDDSTDMTSLLTESAISSDFSGTVTGSSMGANKWGYSLNNTDFLKVPALSSQTKIKTVDHYPSDAELDTTVSFGIKVSSSIPSGDYSKSVIFSAVAHAMPSTLADITTMQEMTPSICANTEEGSSKALTDTRNGNSYIVAKLKDGHCWMTQDLSISDIELTSADTNLPAGTTYTLPASESSWPGEQRDGTPHVFIESTFGGHYNYFAATAGWVNGGDSPQDICPRNWRLPTGSGSSVDEFNVLINAYSSTSGIVNGQPNFFANGSMQSSYYNPGTSGYYWSSTSVNQLQGSLLSIYKSSSSASASSYGGYGTHYGNGIRCLAK